MEYPNILEKFNQWLKKQKDYHLLITITPKDVNARYNLLKRPYNIYCKNNFIDYNESVDRILQMSMPYGEPVKNKKLEYNPSAKSDIKLKKKRKIEEKNTKIKEDKSSKKVKREVPSFNVVKHDDNQENDQEKGRNLLNLKDDSMTSANNNNINLTVDFAQIKGEKSKDSNSFENHMRNDNQIENANEIDKGEVNVNNYNGSLRGFNNQSAINLLHYQNSKMNFNNLPYSNPNYGNYNLDFIKQSSDFNFNGGRYIRIIIFIIVRSVVFRKKCIRNRSSILQKKFNSKF